MHFVCTLNFKIYNIFYIFRFRQFIVSCSAAFISDHGVQFINISLFATATANAKKRTLIRWIVFSPVYTHNEWGFSSFVRINFRNCGCRLWSCDPLLLCSIKYNLTVFIRNVTIQKFTRYTSWNRLICVKEKNRVYANRIHTMFRFRYHVVPSFFFSFLRVLPFKIAIWRNSNNSNNNNTHTHTKSHDFIFCVGTTCFLSSSTNNK